MRPGSRDALTKAANKLAKEKEPVKCRLPSKYRIFFQKSSSPIDEKNTLSSTQLLEFLPKPSSSSLWISKKRTLGDSRRQTSKGHVVGALGGDLLLVSLCLPIVCTTESWDTKQPEPYNAEKFLQRVDQRNHDRPAQLAVPLGCHSDRAS